MQTEWSSTSEIGKSELNHILGNKHGFDTVKPTRLLKTLITACAGGDSLVLDFFAGSGTTADAIIDLNRESDEETKRKYILVETNQYFDNLTLPRVKKVIYAKEWKDGKPTKREGSSHLLKYFALESYEDAMNNLALSRTKEQEQGLLNFTNEFREDYLLNYMLEFEAQGSQSLLNLDNFAAPFNYRMNIAVNGVGETQATPVDLVETFNYLIGLHVERMQQIDGFRVVRGTTRKGERCLILWRTIKDLAQELADKRLNDFLEKRNFDFSEIDTLYINGDTAIPIGHVRKETDTWQIKMIEAEFLRGMFETTDAHR
jgi:adenine-specific DNA-methyltransferase